MNETLNTLMNRRSIRKFKPQQITDSELSAVIDAGLYAPSAKAQQPWKFVVVQNEAEREEVYALNKKLRGMNDPYYSAPTVILVFAEKDAIAPLCYAALAMGNMMNAAYSLGIGTCWIHGEKEMFETEEGKSLMKKWGVGEEYIGVGSIALGYADCEHPKAPKRREDRVVYIK